jgi:Rubredoxin
MENKEIKKHQIKVNLPGGIVSIGNLLQILTILEESAVENVRFGTRQQLYFSVDEDKLEDIEHGFFISDTEFEIDADKQPNIISSYVTEDIFNNSNWLREGVYRDVLDAFDYTPRLKINLADNSQTLIPFFTGNLNFISSEIGNYWYLYIRFPRTNIIYCWSSLIYSEDIGTLSKLVEDAIFSNKDLFYDQINIDGLLLENKVKLTGSIFYQPLSAPLKLPDFQLPYYEGFNKYNDKYWLGIYRRNELFSVSFLKDLCAICAKTRIGQLYTTPWKSIIIKGVETGDKKLWNAVLDKNRINVRHASNELNWQSEDLCEYGLNLKRELINEFNKVDLRTFKLCFAIKTNPKSGLFGSVIIRKCANNDLEDECKFDILHTTDFNPNSKNFTLYKDNLDRASLAEALVKLCDNYYQLQTLSESASADNYYETELVTEIEYVIAHQCSHCLTIYDETWGDEANGVPPGTPFSDLKADYGCAVCGAFKTDIIPIQKESLQTI